MPQIIFIHGDKKQAEEKLQLHFEPDWGTVILPPSVEHSYRLLVVDPPDLIIYSLAVDTESVLGLAQLVATSPQLRDTRKFYLDLTPETKTRLLDAMGAVGAAVYMINYAILKNEVTRTLRL